MAPHNFVTPSSCRVGLPAICQCNACCTSHFPVLPVAMVCSRCSQPGHNARTCPQRSGAHGVATTRRPGPPARPPASAAAQRAHRARAVPPAMKNCPGDRIRHGFDEKWRHVRPDTSLEYTPLRCAPDVIMSNEQTMDLIVGEDMRNLAHCVAEQATQRSGSRLDSPAGCFMATFHPSTAVHLVQVMNTHLRARRQAPTDLGEFTRFLARKRAHAEARPSNIVPWRAAPSVWRNLAPRPRVPSIPADVFLPQARVSWFTGDRGGTECCVLCQNGRLWRSGHLAVGCRLSAVHSTSGLTGVCTGLIEQRP